MSYWNQLGASLRKSTVTLGSFRVFFFRLKSSENQGTVEAEPRHVRLGCNPQVMKNYIMEKQVFSDWTYQHIPIFKAKNAETKHQVEFSIIVICQGWNQGWCYTYYTLYHTKPGDVGSKADEMRSLKHGHQQDGIKDWSRHCSSFDIA